MALFDAGIEIWQEKERADAVRPFTAIHREFGEDVVTAWGGPGLGTRRIPGSERKPTTQSTPARLRASVPRWSRPCASGSAQMNWSLQWNFLRVHLALSQALRQQKL